VADAAGPRIWDAARALVGCRFRLHGRDPDYGLDCVGVALVAARTAGASVAGPDRYGLRGGSAAGWNQALGACGLKRVARAEPGDIVLIDCGREQFHLAVAGPASCVHAHRGLGRVVETPGLPEGAVVGLWRVPRSCFERCEAKAGEG